jgi:hypothetical protein
VGSFSGFGLSWLILRVIGLRFVSITVVVPATSASSSSSTSASASTEGVSLIVLLHNLEAFLIKVLAVGVVSVVVASATSSSSSTSSAVVMMALSLRRVILFLLGNLGTRSGLFFLLDWFLFSLGFSCSGNLDRSLLLGWFLSRRSLGSGLFFLLGLCLGLVTLSVVLTVVVFLVLFLMFLGLLFVMGSHNIRES